MAEIHGQRPPIQTFRDAYGRACVRVPLDPFGKRWATLTATDYARVKPLTSKAWRADRQRCDAQGQVKYYVRGSSRAPRIARIVAQAGIGEQIVHGDGDPFNMLPENLVRYRNRKATTVAG
jgi:hypothetical protein